MAAIGSLAMKTVEVQQVQTDQGKNITRVTITEDSFVLNPIVSYVLIALAVAYLIVLAYQIWRNRRRMAKRALDRHENIDLNDEEHYSSEYESYSERTSATGSYLSYESQKSRMKDTMSNSSIGQLFVDSAKRSFISEAKYTK